MILQTFTSVLYNFIVFTSFVNGYIYFAAHLDDLENVAKKLAPDGIPVQRAKPVAPEPQREEPKDELRVDYYEELDTIMKDYRDAPENHEGETGVDRGQRRKVHGHDANIDQLAKKIKDRVLKELADEFIRLKKQRKQRGRHTKQRKEKNGSKNHYVNVEREEKPYLATTPKASVIKREKYVKPVEEEQIMPSTKKLRIRQLLNTTPNMNMKPNINIEEQVTEGMPVVVKSDEIELEKIDLGTRNNDSYEYYVVPPKDETLLETVEETTTTPPEDMVRYKFQSHAVAELPLTTKLRPQQKIILRPIQDPMYPAVNAMHPTESDMKLKGNDETYILYEMESEEEPKQMQRTTRRTTQRTTQRKTYRPTQKPIRMTRSRYSMTSPDYYASLPTIAERYDFNEPIPTKDRVRSI